MDLPTSWGKRTREDNGKPNSSEMKRQRKDNENIELSSNQADLQQIRQKQHLWLYNTPNHLEAIVDNFDNCFSQQHNQERTNHQTTDFSVDDLKVLDMELAKPHVADPAEAQRVEQQYDQADPSRQGDKDENKHIEKTIHDIMNEEGILQKKYIQGILTSRGLFKKIYVAIITNCLESVWSSYSGRFKCNKIKRYKNLLEIINELKAKSD